jgi:hypothetical protein
VLIYYPLVARSAALLSTEARERVGATLTGLPIDAVWLRLHPFGTATAGPLALRRYLETCRALHVLDLPLVAEHSGTVGVALLAFGAVGGIESGITLGEQVDLTTMLRPPKPDAKAFTPAPRVYLHAIGAFVEVDAAAGLFEARGMNAVTPIAAHGAGSTCGWTPDATSLATARGRSRICPACPKACALASTWKTSLGRPVTAPCAPPRLRPASLRFAADWIHGVGPWAPSSPAIPASPSARRQLGSVSSEAHDRRCAPEC